jgi:hypothetical protein
MSEPNLDYARPSIPRPSSRWTLRPAAVFFWFSTAFLLVTVMAIALPLFGHVGNRWPTVGWVAQFIMCYGNWIATGLAIISVPWAYAFRSAGWVAWLPVCIAVALVVFYWVVAPGDGEYSRMLYGAG